MPEYFNFKSKVIGLTVMQAASFRKRWRLRRYGVAFPFFSDIGALLWSGQVNIRVWGSTPIIESLTTENGGVFIEQETVDGITDTYYGIYMTPEKTASLQIVKYSYNIKFIRASDGFTIRLHEGAITVLPEAP